MKILILNVWLNLSIGIIVSFNISLILVNFIYINFLERFEVFLLI